MFPTILSSKDSNNLLGGADCVVKVKLLVDLRHLPNLPNQFFIICRTGEIPNMCTSNSTLYYTGTIIFRLSFSYKHHEGQNTLITMYDLNLKYEAYSPKFYSTFENFFQIRITFTKYHGYIEWHCYLSSESPYKGIWSASYTYATTLRHHERHLSKKQNLRGENSSN